MNLKYQISIAVSVAVLAFSPIVALGALTHVVAKGDTLYSISKKHNTTVEEIKSLNGLRTNRISVGSVLSVKASKTDSLKTGKSSDKTVTTKKVSSKKSTQAARSYDTYLVKKGDTFVIIAREYGISPKLLKKMNGVKSNRLAIGQQLKVPVLDVTDEPVGVAEASAELSERAEARVALSEGVDDKPVDEMSPMETLRVQHLIDVASNYLGVPYKFGGGNRKGIDCSAF
ncbi:MAG: LysM peptidoglycan-binding domain-containing protein, partial [Nitrospirota bacterium]|nr:LysM peptidoglycan-binding domain-containing protein [Nitrospirota bacterium]